MRVLIGCERSGVVREAFRRRGHDAWSCDVEPADDGGQHIQGDVLDVVGDGWDLAIFHPPCTHLAVSGARYFAEKRADGRQQAALEFVRRLMDCPVPRWGLENPVSIISSQIRKPDQIIQPWQFGHPESKATCLWLQGLPSLRPTSRVHPSRRRCKCGAVLEVFQREYACPHCGADTGSARPVWENQTPSGQNRLGPSPTRAQRRSETYAGIAEAMAEQWGTVTQRLEEGT